MGDRTGLWPGRRPHAALRHCIDRYWAWQSPAHGDRPLSPMLPGPGGVELVFHQGQPFGPRGGASAVQLLAVRERPMALQASASTAFLAVRVRAGAAQTLLGRPLTGLTDAWVDARSAWSATNELHSQLRGVGSFEAQADVIDQFLLRGLRTPQRSVAGLQLATRWLEQADGSVSAAVACTGWSARQFENRFKAATGVSPARFRRLARFRRTVKAMLLAPPRQPMTELLDPSYFDQAQFVRDCQAFIGMAPGEWRSRAADMQHFYLTSLQD
jgi:AraC-like DNA-binding protein